MRIVHDPAELRGLLGPVAFVPTMGALHEGHLELVRAANRHGGTAVVSVFVNPTQFGPTEDFNRYPRDLARDTELVAGAGADVVYAPSVETMYPQGVMTTVRVPEVTDLYEGALRPGHFDGVATVVLKLFNQVRPDVALFGRKDLQQCAVVRRMVDDLNLPVALEFVPTFREPDGLAMSSRNVYLSPEERALAPRLHETLESFLSTFENETFEERLAVGRERLEGAGFNVDYLALVSSRTFQPQSVIGDDSAVIAAAKLGRTRLIDNFELRAS